MSAYRQLVRAAAVCIALGVGSTHSATIVVSRPGSMEPCVSIEPGDFTLVIQVRLSDGDPGSAVLAATDFVLDGVFPLGSFAIPNPTGRWGDAGDLGMSFDSCVPTDVVLWTVKVFDYDGSPLAVKASPTWFFGCPHVTTCDGTVLCAAMPVLCINNPGCCTSAVTKSTWTGVKATYR